MSSDDEVRMEMTRMTLEELYAAARSNSLKQETIELVKQEINNRESKSQQVDGVAVPQEMAIERKIISRYKDAYLTARTVDAVGSGVKVIGIILAVIISISSLSTSQGGYGGFGLIFGLLLGVVIGGFIYLLGIIISAQGQILLASLDCAVNSSPFLNNGQKSKAMLL